MSEIFMKHIDDEAPNTEAPCPTYTKEQLDGLYRDIQKMTGV